MDTQNEAYAKYYKHLQHLAVEKIIIKFKYRVIFRQYISNKTKCFSNKIYKLCDETRYTYGMRVYWVLNYTAIDGIIVTHASVTHLTC